MFKDLILKCAECSPYLALALKVKSYIVLAQNVDGYVPALVEPLLLTVVSDCLFILRSI